MSATIATGLHGQTATISKTPDSSLDGFTGNVTFTTPNGSVVAQYGGSNNYQTNQARLGQTGVTKGDFTISSSTDPAISNADGGSFESYGSAINLQYTDFGTWSLNPCSNTTNCTPAYAGTFGGAKQGQALTSTMPTTGTATYTGGAVGYVVQPVANNSHNAGEFFGTTSLTANFATNAVNGSITSINVYNVGNGGSGQTLLGTMNDIGLTGTISGSTFAGTTNVTGSAGTAFDISGATGQVKGGFYGPSANETAGVFYLTGGTNNTALVGSFGAKQAAPSDRRLKVDIESAGSLPNGLKLYVWRYLGGSHRFTGVMAQDLMFDPRYSDAVAVDADGLMRVDYSAVGYLPADFDLMRAEGEQAIALYRRTSH